MYIVCTLTLTLPLNVHLMNIHIVYLHAYTVTTATKYCMIYSHILLYTPMQQFTLKTKETHTG